ncbi:hypothetical protein CIB48_g10098 [Xylaria polymorpha]|nr:hypothetical protein CIB48_g10098 [Xylaria polymorpha]
MAGPAPVRSLKERAQDELVMQTNSSSIVSKRSVERIYYPDEPHYFRYFVKKFQRRAPLINRGYHIRLHVIDAAVRRFLERPGHKTKVVVNLGCGRYPDACHRAKFIDIDFPDLMSKKRTIVLNTPELSSVFEPLHTDASEHVLLNSDMYSQIGCDLRNTADIEKAFSKCLDPSECIFMFVAEVSITYMETLGADGVIKWASSLSQAEFCLLEQILPDGPNHPFAKTMLSHFEKLKTPLKSVFEYPHLEAQNHRFSSLGWSQVQAVSLWQIWTDDEWISASKRRELDLVEPFDEWEEFALFASHYCVVIARNFAHNAESAKSDVDVAKCRPQSLALKSLFHGYLGVQGKRRFGATLQTRNELGETVFINTFGLGTNIRLKSCDLYSFESLAPGIRICSVGPSSRVCHSIVDLGSFGSLLVGGEGISNISTARLLAFQHRTKQVVAYRRSPNTVIPTRDGTTRTIQNVHFNRRQSQLFDGLRRMPYTPTWFWLDGVQESRLVDDNSEPPTMHFEGILAGGLLEDGTVARQLLRWSLKLSIDGSPTISFKPIEASTDTEFLICRFGAAALLLEDKRIMVVGGIQHDGIVPRVDEVIVINTSDSGLQIISCCSIASFDKSSVLPRPLLVGTSVSLADHQLVVMGGGATCFSMGTYWNEGCYAVNLGTLLGDSPSTTSRGPLRFQKLIEVIDQSQRAKNFCDGDLRPQRATISGIPRICVNTEDDFEKILRAGKPTIIEGSDLGTCIQKWTGVYLTENVGPQRKVVVHEASSLIMDFNAKNFSYATKHFTSFMEEVEKGGKQYLRALSQEHPSDHPANIEADFPAIASDFKLPPELSFVKRNEHSSVLRISGRVNMWLHYDVMANVYCQIAGSKKLLLFPPDDVSHLSFAPGASSSSIDVFSGLETPALALTHPHEATLGPGDVLFLPPLWLHSTAPLTDLGVAVNVFFRNLETGYSSGRDVYGNRDIAAYEKGRVDVARITNSFRKLPRDVQSFYMRRLADEMAQNILR